MKSLAFILTLLVGGFTLGSQTASANGAVIVFQPVAPMDYEIRPAIDDDLFNTSNLFNILESSTDDLYVARVDPYIFRWAQYHTGRGDYFLIPFTGYEDVTFSYFGSLRAIVGVSAHDDIIILLPEQRAKGY